MEDLTTLTAAADAQTRAVRADELVDHYQEMTAEASRARREALTELVEAGWSHGELGKLLGKTRSRVGQILSTGPRPERALLGTGAITVAIGGKDEGAGKKTQASAVVSTEALAAYHLIRDTCAEHKLDAEYEVVPPPGMVRLNRDNLIVMGSPRILPLVGQVLEADSDLGFDSGAQGWYLVDRTAGVTYRSPSDSGEPADYAYLGRLPRPDGRGTFLYVAGIHAMGTLGGARYLTEHLAELYVDVRARRWSALVKCCYDADTREIVSTERVSPIYKP